jgi:hypothetical protein
VVAFWELLTYSNFENKNTLFQIIDFIFQVTILCSKIIFYFFMNDKNIWMYLIRETYSDFFKLYMTFKNFINSFAIINKLRKLKDIDENDLIEIDSTCLICLNEMKTGKKISCGHIFHYSCLKTWIQGAVS